MLLKYILTYYVIYSFIRLITNISYGSAHTKAYMTQKNIMSTHIFPTNTQTFYTVYSRKHEFLLLYDKIYKVNIIGDKM